MSDASQEAQAEPQRDSEQLAEVRAWGERNEQRAKELAEELAKEREISRQSAIRQAGVDPTSYFGQSVMAAVERDGISDPEDIAALVRLARADAQGGA